jgi:hypothetical protein
MSQDRISACNVSALVGREQSQAVYKKQRDQFNAEKGRSQTLLHGNRSGHDKNKPGSFQNANHKNRFRSLQKCKSRIHDTYFNPLAYDFGKASYHQDKSNKSGSYKRLRSEMRNVIKLVSECIVHHVNLKLMIFGFPAKNGELVTFGIDYIFKKVNVSLKSQGLHEISYRRIRDAVSYLCRHGYITVKENKELRLDNTWRSKPATIYVSRTLFYDLDITDDEINEHIRKDLKVINQEAIERKAAEYKAKERFEKKADKAKRKNIQQLLTKHKDGLTLTQDEKDILKEESPGYDRIRNTTQSTVYADYTGVSTNREEVIKRNSPPSDTAKSFLKDILNKLKPPS